MVYLHTCRIQARLIPEMEKKLSGKHVMFVAQRRILAKPAKTSHIKKQPRPISRTLTAVHEAILNDIVYPTEIVGKRMRVRVDGTRVNTMYLNHLQTCF